MSEQKGGRPMLPAKGTAGEALRAFRKKHKITLEEASMKTGMSKGALSDIERGATSPTMKTLERIAVGLGADLDVLLKRQRRK